MKISCVILNYNDAPTTVEAINRAKEIDDIAYVIVIDNCSPDGDYESLSKQGGGKVFVYKTTYNGGYGYGNNYGLTISKKMGATHVIIANPDVSFDESCVSALKQVFKKNADCAVAAPCTYFRGKPCFSKLPTVKEVLLESSSIHNRLFGRTTEYELNDNTANEIVCEVVVGAMLAIDVTKLKLPIYDEKMFLYCEEWVLGTKAREAGYTTIVSLNADYIHLLSHSINASYNSLYKKRKLSNKSKLYFIANYFHVEGIKYALCKIWFKGILVEAKVIDLVKKYSGK